VQKIFTSQTTLLATNTKLLLALLRQTPDGTMPSRRPILPRRTIWVPEANNTQVGERYKCSDVNCACEIEVTKPSRMQNESFGSGSMNTGSLNDRSHTNQPIGGQATGETGASPTGVGSLRDAESATISTPGDFGSQGATGEGVFGTSGGNQRSAASGRLGSTTDSTLKSDSPSGSQRSGTSSIEAGPTGEANFYCLCGQPMEKPKPAVSQGCNS
jgi:hypothetical protein